MNKNYWSNEILILLMFLWMLGALLFDSLTNVCFAGFVLVALSINKLVIELQAD